MPSADGHEPQRGTRRQGTRRRQRSSWLVPHLTMTLTNPFVQQHCAWPAPVRPDASLARTRTRYSPGAVNVACVDARPPVTSTRDDGGANVTPRPAAAGGDWCGNHVSVTGALLRPPRPTLLDGLPSSRAQTPSVTGEPTEAEIGPDVMPSGPLPSGPFASNLSTGGVLPDPASPSSASICQFGRRFPGIAY